jgi:serine/threonine protein kinase
MLRQQTVGRFEIRDFLGRGAIGDVLLAWDPERSQEVALKVIRTQKTEADVLEAEKTGAALQAQLARVAPQVAGVLDAGSDDDFFWVAMEYVDGTDLSRVLSKGPLPEDLSVSIALQLCSMLEICHAFSAEIGGRQVLGVIHGDIKPENIRLQGEDRVRVLDFGIAKHLSQTRRFTVNLFGSLPYTPPERLERGVVDFHSDLWAVAIVLYICVSGNRPFPGDTPEELETRIRRGERPLPLPDTCSPRLQRILKRCLCFEVDRRYPTASSLRADLEAFRDGRPLADELDLDESSATRRTRPPAAELDATRRTDRSVTPLPATEATRRTGGEDFVPPPPPPPPIPGPLGQIAEAKQEAPVVPQRRPRHRGRQVVTAFALLLVLFSQTWVWSEMKEVRHSLVTNTRPDVDAVWERYRRASRVSLIGPFLGGTREELQRALVQSGDRILDSYHGDDPTTTERGWQKAEGYLKAAVEMSFRDKESRAKMMYARAHLDRIAAQTLRNQGKTKEAAEKTREAIYEFRDAAKRVPNWPDPYLGLARIYAYDKFDLPELEKALGELARRGYPHGRRETAMLADGYRMRGKELLARAQKVSGTDEEPLMLERARDHLTQAIALYADIPSFANSRANRADSEANLDVAMNRLWELGF